MYADSISLISSLVIWYISDQGCFPFIRINHTYNEISIYMHYFWDRFLIILETAHKVFSKILIYDLYRIIYILAEKSNNCAQNEHGLCNGNITEVTNGGETAKICNCACHNSMYQLIRNTVALVNRSNKFV